MDVVHAIENVAKGSQDRPVDDVLIADSGEIIEEETGTTTTTEAEGHTTAVPPAVTTIKNPETTLVDMTPNPPVTSTPEKSKPPQYSLFGTGVFAFGSIGVLAALFVWLGGLRYLQRMRSGGDSQYRKLGIEGGAAQ